MRKLENEEYGEVWDAFYAEFTFKPSVQGPFPGIDEPPGSVTFEFHEGWTDADIDDFATVVRAALQAASPPGEEVYYLDWHHECFAFDPHETSRPWFNGFPDGDYAIFVSRDFSFGTFGHPWEQTICCFGAALVRVILANRPRLFAKVKRRSPALADTVPLG